MLSKSVFGRDRYPAPKPYIKRIIVASRRRWQTDLHVSGAALRRARARAHSIGVLFSTVSVNSCSSYSILAGVWVGMWWFMTISALCSITIHLGNQNSHGHGGGGGGSLSINSTQRNIMDSWTDWVWIQCRSSSIWDGKSRCRRRKKMQNNTSKPDFVKQIANALI